MHGLSFGTLLLLEFPSLTSLTLAQGLIPRAKQLLTLGVTFFLAFAPVVLAISLLFSGIFWVRHQFTSLLREVSAEH